MVFKTINETENFIYKDCVINEAHINENAISFVVEALIVKASNSQNSNFTNSYSGDNYITFIRPVIEKMILMGYRKYDADDRLLSEVEDKEIDLPGQELRSLLQGAFLTNIEKDDNGSYLVSIEIADEDPYAISDEYEIKIICDEVIVEWDKYLNRVQEM